MTNPCKQSMGIYQWGTCLSTTFVLIYTSKRVLGACIMKKIFSIIIAITIMLSLAACDNEADIVKCKNCKAENVHSASFCSSCGKSLVDEEFSSQPSQNADITDKTSDIPEELGIEMCQNEHIAVTLDHIEKGKIYIKATNKTDEDIRLDVNYIEVDGVMYTNTFEGEMIYSGKTQTYRLVVYSSETGEEIKYNCEIGSIIEGQFEYFSDEYSYCEDIKYGPLTVE